MTLSHRILACVAAALLTLAGAQFSHASSYIVLHAFGGSEGAYPERGLTKGNNGYLYGTTAAGGLYRKGTVFAIRLNGQYTILHHFTGGKGGELPTAPVIEDADGNLFGTTISGGGANAGTVYEITADGKFSILHSFTSPLSPSERLVEDSTGTIYGTTVGDHYQDCGTVFAISPDHTFQTIYKFNCSLNGNAPSTLLPDNKGDLYGMAADGPLGGGTLFKLAPPKPDKTHWTFVLLHSFCSQTIKLDSGDIRCLDGRFPSGGGLMTGGLITDGQGDFLGATQQGGTTDNGTLFKFSPRTGMLTTLYNFTGGLDGGLPNGGLAHDKSGNIYGTTAAGGSVQWGVAFELSPLGALTVLHDFTYTPDGGEPGPHIIFGPNNYLYGTADQGGPANVTSGGVGVVFVIVP